MLRAILDQGSDVQEFGRQYDSQLRGAELDSIQDYILESDNLSLLHRQVCAKSVWLWCCMCCSRFSFCCSNRKHRTCFVAWKPCMVAYQPPILDPQPSRFCAQASRMFHLALPHTQTKSPERPQAAHKPLPYIRPTQKSTPVHADRGVRLHPGGHGDHAGQVPGGLGQRVGRDPQLAGMPPFPLRLAHSYVTPPLLGRLMADSGEWQRTCSRGHMVHRFCRGGQTATLQMLPRQTLDRWWHFASTRSPTCSTCTQSSAGGQAA